MRKVLLAGAIPSGLFLAQRRGLTRNESRMGRLLRDGEGHEGASPMGGVDNTGGAGGNMGQNAQNGGQSQNNTGDAFDPVAFWNGPDQSGQGGNSGGSAPSGNSDSGTQGQQGQQQGQGGLAGQITERLNSLSFGNGVLTPEIAEQINQGNFQGFQDNLNRSMQQAVRESLAMNVQILRPFAEQLMQQMRDEFGQTLNQRDDTDTLVRDFPAAKNPALAQAIRPIFDQALKNAKGNRELAVRQTKQMMSYLATGTATDLGLDVAPAGSGGESSRQSQQSQSINWLDELTGR